jgi:hypothetical protein
MSSPHYAGFFIFLKILEFSHARIQKSRFTLRDFDLNKQVYTYI